MVNFYWKFNFKSSLLIVSVGMINSETFNFGNLLYNQYFYANDPNNNNLGFPKVRTMGQIFQVDCS